MQYFRQTKNRSALYRQGWCFRLRHLEFNIVMTYIYTKQHDRFNWQVVSGDKIVMTYYLLEMRITVHRLYLLKRFLFHT